MNIHPIIIHFPIALLITYAVFELIRFRKVAGQPYWFYIKSLLVIFGTLGGYAALLTGDTARRLITDTSLRPLIRAHESWGQISVIIFSVLAAGYLVAWIKRSGSTFLQKIPPIKQLWPLIVWFQVLITETPLVWLLAAAGIVSLTVTGALGGSIIYGHTGDPFTDWIYHLIF